METCPCCGYKTLRVKGGYDLCPICFWEDDTVQFGDPDYGGGANRVSLRQAQSNFMEFGASEVQFRKNVRKPLPSDKKDLIGNVWRVKKGNNMCYEREAGK